MTDASFGAREAKYSYLMDRPRLTVSDDESRSAIFLAADQKGRRNGMCHDEIATRKNTAKWVNAAFRLEILMAELKRSPRESVSAAERVSAVWARYQRRRWDSLCSYQKDWLESMPAFSRDPLGELADAQVANYVAVVEKINRAPKRSSDDPGEVCAARWATKQRMLYRRGTLPKHRVDEFSELKYWWWESRG